MNTKRIVKHFANVTLAAGLVCASGMQVHLQCTRADGKVMNTPSVCVTRGPVVLPIPAMPAANCEVMGGPTPKPAATAMKGEKK